MGSPKISTGVLIGHTENCASCYSCTNLVRAQPNKLQSCKQPKFSTAVLILVVETKDIVLASQAVLTLYGQSRKISTAVHSQKLAQLGEKIAQACWPCWPLFASLVKTNERYK